MSGKGGGYMTEQVRRCEDVIAWQKARELMQAIYRATREEQFARGFALSGRFAERRYR